MNAAATSAESLREAMIAKIKDVGYTLSSAVENALRTVERHVFVPAAALVDAYANDIVVTKRGADNEVLSCLSQPSIVALQLGQLDVQPGHRVLEIGAGTGYNAALLAHLAGPRGQVVTVDVDTDIVAHARERLTAAGVGNVAVVLGDGALGHPAGAPYDRVVATVGAYGIPDDWLSQLTPAGRLVVPLRIRGGVSRSITFERDADDQMCGFVPLRAGVADDPRRMIALTADKAVKLQLNQEHTAISTTRLAGVFDRPRVEVWTAVAFSPMQSVEWLYLWLACTVDNGLCRMPVEQAAIDSGLVKPMFRWGAMAVPGDGELAHQVAAEIRVWDECFRHREVRFEIPVTGTDVSDPQAGRFFLDRPHNPITVIWSH